MKVYKVTKNLCSCIFDYTNTRVKYEIGKWTTPTIKNSKLFAFSNILQALRFFDTFIDSSGLAVWECDASDVEENKKQILVPIFFSSTYSYWNSPDYTLVKGTQPPIDGAVLCSAIKLIRKVYPYEPVSV